MADLIKRIPEGFTPGPWYVSGVRVKMDRAIFHAINFPKNERADESIALVFYDEKQHRACWHDANLIALAPDLAAEVRTQAARIAELEAEVARLGEIIVAAEQLADVVRRRSQGMRALQTAPEKSDDYHVGRATAAREIAEGIHRLMEAEAARAALAAPDTGGADGGDR